MLCGVYKVLLKNMLKFSKPTKDLRDTGFATKFYKHKNRRKKTKLAKKGHSVLKFRIPKEKSRSKLVKELDKLFSDYIKKKAKGECMRCTWVRGNAGVSHFYSRRIMGLRWDKDNCDWACWGCHHYHLEHFKQPGQFYETYLIKKLGVKGYDKLIMKSGMITKYSTSDIKLMIQNFNKIWK